MPATLSSAQQVYMTKWTFSINVCAIDMHAASFKHSLLSVHVDVCLWLCIYGCPNPWG